MLTSILKRESAVTVGIAEAVAIYLIYQHQLPSNADTRSISPHNSDIESSRKQAAWESAALLGVVFLISRDLNAFIIGGIALLGVDTSYKHANAVNPASGKADMSGGNQSIAPSFGGPHSLPDYSDSASA